MLRLSALATALCMSACAALVIALAPANAHADTKWDPVPAADLAAPPPPDDPDAEAEILEWNAYIDDNVSAGDFQNVTRHFKRIKIFNKTGAQDYGQVRIDYVREATLSDVSARTILPDGTVLPHAREGGGGRGADQGEGAAGAPALVCSPGRSARLRRRVPVHADATRRVVERPRVRPAAGDPGAARRLSHRAAQPAGPQDGLPGVQRAHRGLAAHGRGLLDLRRRLAARVPRGAAHAAGAAGARLDDPALSQRGRDRTARPTPRSSGASTGATPPPSSTTGPSRTTGCARSPPRSRRRLSATRCAPRRCSTAAARACACSARTTRTR